jgi:hypothetical protein
LVLCQADHTPLPLQKNQLILRWEAFVVFVVSFFGTHAMRISGVVLPGETAAG